jgi:hypothetical protein
MKSIALLLMTGATIGYTSCNNASDNKTTSDTSTNVTSIPTPDTTTPATTTNTMASAVVTPPEKTRTYFEKKYPKAAKVTWSRKNRADYNSSNPDSIDYQVTYNMDNMEYTSWYDYNGNYIMTTEKVDNANLPPAVNKTINKQFPGYTVGEIQKEDYKGQASYEIDLDKGSDKLKVNISPAGKVLKKHSRGLGL